MATALLMAAAGLGILYWAGERLVSYAAAIAEKAGIAPSVVGLTVVAAGTSAPELFVSLIATFQGRPEIAAGNVLGSNIANLTLILGLTALVRPMPVESRLLKLDYPFLMIASFAALVLCRDARFDRLEALLSAAAGAGFIGYSVLAARKVVGREEARELAEAVPGRAESLRRRSYAALALGLLGSVALLSAGSRLLVDGASLAAALLGVSDRVIALTAVAIGTSLPELTASVLAAWRGHLEMAAANLVGSNIFNLLFILGACGLVRPVVLSPRLAGQDFWAMLAAAGALAPLVYGSRRVSRPAGAALAAGYALYAVFFIVE